MKGSGAAGKLSDSSVRKSRWVSLFRLTLINCLSSLTTKTNLNSESSEIASCLFSTPFFLVKKLLGQMSKAEFCWSRRLLLSSFLVHSLYLYSVKPTELEILIQIKYNYILMNLYNGSRGSNSITCNPLMFMELEQILYNFKLEMVAR